MATKAPYSPHLSERGQKTAMLPHEEISAGLLPKPKISAVPIGKTSAKKGRSSEKPPVPRIEPQLLTHHDSGRGRIRPDYVVQLDGISLTAEEIGRPSRPNRKPAPSGESNGFSTAAKKLLKAAGVPDKLLDSNQMRVSHRQVQRLAEEARNAAVSSSVSVAEAAHLLGQSDSEIYESIANQRLYCIPGLAGQDRLPSWQFVNGQTVPHIHRVIEKLPNKFPLTVESFFLTKNEYLAGMSPAQWLLAGRSLQRVTDLADFEARR